MVLTLSNALLTGESSVESENGTLTVGNRTVHYDRAGKCVEVIDANTIQVYGVGRVQLTQVGIDSEADSAKKFVEEKCLSKIVYLDVDDKKPTDKYGRTLAVVYTDTDDINRELIDSGMAKISYFTPSEFKKGEV